MTPSIWPEPFGRIAVEANRLEVPAIVSSFGGLPETIEQNITGFVFRAGDSEDLAEKIMKLYEKEFGRHTIMLRTNERLNAEAQINKLLKLFEVLVYVS